ncbi:hypothetical protein Bbelb_436400 [Branchiostoma belcheri]|nr:hypothetical protein Bbelb_436400 [Branchiostoma belcheri]
MTNPAVKMEAYRTTLLTASRRRRARERITLTAGENGGEVRGDPLSIKLAAHVAWSNGLTRKTFPVCRVKAERSANPEENGITKFLGKRGKCGSRSRASKSLVSTKNTDEGDSAKNRQGEDICF